MTARITVEQHAAERFVERFRKDLTVDEAREYLVDVATVAARLRGHCPVGRLRWQVAEPPCTLIVTRDVGDKFAIVTVLERHESFDEKLQREVAEAEADRLPPRLSQQGPPVEPRLRRLLRAVQAMERMLMQAGADVAGVPELRLLAREAVALAQSLKDRPPTTKEAA